MATGETCIILIAIAIVLILTFLARRASEPVERLTSYPDAPRWVHNQLFFPLPRSMGELRAVEQVRTLTEMLGDGEGGGDDGPDPEQIKKENAYIMNLPQSEDCTDNYEGCPVWAENGECVINPEYMLYNCAKSCKACALGDQEKYNITYIYNNRPPPACVYHGEDYPSTARYLNKLYMLNP